MKSLLSKILNPLSIIVLSLFILFSCSQKSSKNITSNFYNYNEKIFYFGDSLKFTTSSKHHIDSVVLQIGNKKILNPQYIVLDSSDFKYGKNSMIQNVYFTKNDKNRNIKYTGSILIHPSIKEKEIGYEIINEYTHNTSDFTQGLIYTEDDYIIESTGEYGSSKLLKYKLGSESYSKQIGLSNNYFGEGTTILNNKIYQLTWKKRKGFVYDLSSFEKIKEFSYPTQIQQGWGLTTDGIDIILSDGSQYLYFIDEAQLSKINKKIEVLGHKRFYTYLNELEYANNYVYANTLDSDYILIINPGNGVVVGRVDLKAIAEKYRKYGVLNGIAYYPKNNSFIITGKNWPKMFEIVLEDLN